MAKAKLGKFKCPKCNRTFSMAAHLARHLSAAHGAKKKRKTTKKKRAKRTARRVVRQFARPAKRVRRAAVGETAPLLQQMHAYRDKLVVQRDQVVSQIDAIDQALAAMAGATRAPTTRRARGRRATVAWRGGATRRGSLKHYVERVLRAGGAAMAVKDVTAAVRKAGFSSKNKTLPKSVGIAMTQMPNVTKVARGVFRLK